MKYFSVAAFAILLFAGQIQLMAQGEEQGRGTFEVNGYAGVAVDSFASGDVKSYLNPQDSGNARLQHAIGGFDFQYRLYAPKTPKKTRKSFANQLWIYGEAKHGVRSADVDCKKNPLNSHCGSAFLDTNLYMLRDATSIEGYIGLRYEFLTLNPKSKSPANIYINAKGGFLSVGNNGNDIVNNNHIGIGALITGGKFQGSFVEFGGGRNDLFGQHRRSRKEIDGFITWKIFDRGNLSGIKPFMQIAIDTDMSTGSDSIQSYYGVRFDMVKLLNFKGK